MTKEEAIYVLKNTDWLGSAELAGDVIEAVKMAVNVLKRSEAPNSSDTISRQAAIDAVEHITSSMSVCVNTDECYGMKRMQKRAVIELTNLPSAQPEPEHTMEEFMYGQDLGSPEDGSL